jgi:hypothetical protein
MEGPSQDIPEWFFEPFVNYRGTSLLRNIPPPHRTTMGPRHSPTAGYFGRLMHYERGTPVVWAEISQGMEYLTRPTN